MYKQNTYGTEWRLMYSRTGWGRGSEWRNL